MQNLFYVPPHQPQDTHPRPPGVRTVVKRNQPTRLDLTVPHPGFVQVPLPRKGSQPPGRTRLTALRVRLGQFFIRMGTALTPDETTQTGQPA